MEVRLELPENSLDGLLNVGEERLLELGENLGDGLDSTFLLRGGGRRGVEESLVKFVETLVGVRVRVDVLEIAVVLVLEVSVFVAVVVVVVVGAGGEVDRVCS